MAFLLTAFTGGLSRAEKFIEHPIDSVENAFTSTAHFVTHPVQDTKSFVTTEKNNVSDFVQHPLSSVENEIRNVTNEIKEIPTAVKKGFENVETLFTTIEDDARYVGKEVAKDAKWIWQEAEIVAKDVYTGGSKIVHFTENTFLFFENYYKTILFIGGSYLAAKYVGAIKEATK